jgi:hypothetical protein
MAEQRDKYLEEILALREEIRRLTETISESTYNPIKLIGTVTLTEREACAKLAEKHRAPAANLSKFTFESNVEIWAEARGEEIAAHEIAKKIRARGLTPDHS